MTDLPVDARFVILCFEDATRTLRALPQSGFSTRISQGRNDVVHDEMEAYGWTDLLPRQAIPSASKITAMEEILSWVRFIRQVPVRKIVNWRSNTHPASGKPLPWTHIGKLVSPHDPIERHTIQRWHSNGIAQIVEALNQGRGGHLPQYLDGEVEPASYRAAD